jgi:hypothetical protein
MKISLQPFFILWMVLAVAVLVLAMFRKTVATHVDSALQHVLDGEAAKPSAEAQKLDQIDRWGKLLTIIAAAYGLLLGVLYLYQGWGLTPGIGA